MPDADSLQPVALSGQQPDPTPLTVLPDVNAGMPGPGFIDGELHLDSTIAPQVPPGAPRPFAPGEYIRNPDGGWSSEITVTPQLPNGLYVNVPSLWLIDGHPYVAASEDEALQLAIQSKLPFQTYQTEGAAVQASKDREANWTQYEQDPAAARATPSLWDQRLPVASDALDLSSILPLRPNSPTMLEQAIGNIKTMLNPPVSTGPSYNEGDIIPSPASAAIGDALAQEYAGQGGGMTRDREMPLANALSLGRMQADMPTRDDRMDNLFSPPQYPAILPQLNQYGQVLKPTVAPPSLDPLGPSQSGTALPEGPFGDVLSLLRSLTSPLIGLPYTGTMNPFPRFVPKKMLPANEALLRGTKPLPQDPSQET